MGTEIRRNPRGTMAHLVSVNVGLPREIEWHGQTVRTGIWKTSVAGRRMARRLNIDGDGQGDLQGHGGEQRAVFVYQLGSYRHWEQELHRTDFVPGQFGENFTLDGEGGSDEEVCIGDRYRVGGALLEVTQPRTTCYRVGIRMQEPRMPSLLVAHGRPGFYFRVLEEGEVGAGDALVKVADGPERMTVAEANALLYMPGHPRQALERALRIAAFSPGWRASFQALLAARTNGHAVTGNQALAPAGPEATPGFHAVRVAQVTRESASVTSFVLESLDGSSLPAALPGQFVVLRLPTTPKAGPTLRSYSLSGAPGQPQYRISVKREPGGVGSGYLHGSVRVGDVLDVSGPRGSFVLAGARDTVVLLSAGVGATPVLAMLHALAMRPSPPKVWWLQAARNGEEYPFAREAQDLLRRLPDSRRVVVFSRPTPRDRVGEDFDRTGHFGVPLVEELGVPRDAAFYLCGPPSFLHDMSAGLVAWGVAAERVRTEIFGPGASVTPGVVGAHARHPHAPSGPEGAGPRVSFARSGLTVRWNPACGSLLELAEACDVPVKWSCRTGVCHTCETGLVSGHVSLLPEPIEPAAPGNTLTCCARPTDDVDLDL
jgi:ferredoxin-NADP reductase/MOSC domain-containing protein YiiM